MESQRFYMAYKQKTVNGKTIKLLQRSSDKKGKQYRYYVTISGKRFGNDVFTLKDGMKQFRAAKRKAKGKQPGGQFGTDIVPGL